MSEAEKAQRRTAAVKTGKRSKSVLTQAGHPCKRSTCLVGKDNFPCDVRQAVVAEGHGMAHCAPALLMDSRAQAMIQKAIESGDNLALAELAAGPLAAMHHLASAELAQVQREGFAISEDSMGKDGEVFSRLVKNPRAEVLGTYAQHLGWTMAQQGATPKSSAESRRDAAASDLLTLMASGRRLLEAEA